mgnify:FL=1
MKHIRLYEEYTRTVGFRYSEPTLKFQIDFNFTDETLDQYDLSDDIKLAFADSDTKCDSVNRHDNGYSAIISIYNEKELNSVIEEFEKFMHDEYQVELKSDLRVRKSTKDLLPNKKVSLDQDLFKDRTD